MDLMISNFLRDISPHNLSVTFGVDVQCGGYCDSGMRFCTSVLERYVCIYLFLFVWEVNSPLSFLLPFLSQILLCGTIEEVLGVNTWIQFVVLLLILRVKLSLTIFFFKPELWFNARFFILCISFYLQLSFLHSKYQQTSTIFCAFEVCHKRYKMKVDN